MSRAAAIIATGAAVVFVTAVAILLSRDSGPSPTTELALAGIDSRLDRLDELVAELARARLAPGPASIADELSSPDNARAAAPNDETESDDGDGAADTATGDDAGTLIARLDDLETRLRGLEEDPIQRGYMYLTSENAQLRVQGLYALERIANSDPQARAAIRDMLGDVDVGVRRAALDTLGDIGDRESMPLIASLLDDESATVRREAIVNLSRLGGKDYGAEVAGMLGDGDAKVREAAADTLGRFKFKEAGSALLEALNDSSEAVRGEAIASLGEVGEAAALPALREMWNTNPGQHRQRLLYTMKNLGDPAPYQSEVQRVSQEVLTNADAEKRRRSIRYLAWFARGDAKPTLQKALEDPDPRVRREAERVLRGDRGERGRR